MNQDDTGSRQVIIRDLFRYLVANPDAKDTIEGVLQWWLLKGGTALGVREVQEAVDFLVSKEWLIEREATPSKKIYGMNKSRIKEIRAFIDEFED
ncbi:hypothetical protein [Candidatus Manganitrophus noduliformans]|uniref:ArsR family transcriptional regulator n=1 Tax=Candidatus Manganitrophus noduliformans TaxID=2606439 RepID=A0A7X6ICY1_9BACT|nr:hypothetical protein [Candidatus Manganitrophus noduliformans]NKE72894.1 hypothetical protein [Candidatus Manganitrophus noduliformans]